MNAKDELSVVPSSFDIEDVTKQVVDVLNGSPQVLSRIKEIKLVIEPVVNHRIKITIVPEK